MSYVNNIKDKLTRDFAEACFDMNSIEDLKEPFHEGDKTDLETWGLTFEQFEEARQAALQDKLDDLEDENKKKLTQTIDTFKFYSIMNATKQQTGV